MRRVVAATALFACGLSACIIGPKQDDPAEDRLVDAGTIFADSTAGGGGDTAMPPVADSAPGPPPDDAGALDSTDADAASDAADGADAPLSDAGDAVVDGDAAEGG